MRLRVELREDALTHGGPQGFLEIFQAGLLDALGAAESLDQQLASPRTDASQLVQPAVQGAGGAAGWGEG